MSGKDAQRVNVIAAPESGCAVVRGSSKVKSLRSEIHIPHWVVVPLVANQVRKRARTPQARYLVIKKQVEP